MRTVRRNSINSWRLNSRALGFPSWSRWSLMRNACCWGDRRSRLRNGFRSILRGKALHPLGMVDTSYRVPPSQHHRVATVYRRNGAAGWIELALPNKFENPILGDGGLYSTAHDYGRFIQMILKGGLSPEGRPLISGDTLRMIGKNHVGDVVVETQPAVDEIRTRPFPLGAGEDKLGLGFQLASDRGQRRMRSSGSLSWAGIFNTQFWIDRSPGDWRRFDDAVLAFLL